MLDAAGALLANRHRTHRLREPALDPRYAAGPARPPGAAFLGYAGVLPQALGLGAGRAVGDAILGWALHRAIV